MSQYLGARDNKLQDKRENITGTCNTIPKSLRPPRPQHAAGSLRPCTGRGLHPWTPPPEEGELPGAREGSPGRGQGPAARG